MTATWFDAGVPRAALRALVLLHAFALLVLPKNLFGVRPEDVTGALLLAAAGIAFLSAPRVWPAPFLTRMVAAYFAYLVVVLVTRDFPQGYIQASVFWFKELSYAAFAYLIWRAYRTEPLRFVTAAVVMAIPNLAFGIYQVITTPIGIYGVSPFGHANSPGSSGMVYFAISAVVMARCVLHPAIWPRPLLVAALVLVVASGSRMSLVGAMAFFGWYLLLVVWRERTARSIGAAAAFGVAAVAATTTAVALANDIAWSGLVRYRGLLDPIDVITTRGIWWKVRWIEGPWSAVFGSGFSVPHLEPGQPYSYGMAMDNQALYYLITGGIVSFALYLLLLGRVYRVTPLSQPEGRLLRSIVLAYIVMGLGAEVLQLSIHGNVFWMVVGLSLAVDHWRQAVSKPENAFT